MAVLQRCGHKSIAEGVLTLHLVPGCARFAEILSELTKTWSSGATECGV